MAGEKMKRASYRAGIEWIAVNDSAGEASALNPDSAAYYVSSLLLADLFGVEPARVGEDIVAYRKKAARDAADHARTVRRWLRDQAAGIPQKRISGTAFNCPACLGYGIVSVIVGQSWAQCDACKGKGVRS